ncbi:MAG TPA: menaquinol-cytochrome c reductase cytochrome b subunit [Acidimicrobiia bacterium]|nr:menaquinol-cytochrome c reductase cytochrome b subunit [Acidimicrobiia bacterium]
MTEVPEHLLRRSRERRKALGLPVPGEEGGEEAAAEAAPEGPAAEPSEPAAAEAPAGAPAGGGAEDTAAAAAASGVPAHLLERSKRRRAQLTGEGEGDGGAAAPAAATTGGGATATATAPKPTPTATGPGGHTQRLLTVVKSGSIQQTRAEAQDKVHVWPHLLVIEFAAVLVVTAALLIFSALVRAPLLGLADFNKTPNPSKAPWYFLGLQELLTMFHPMVAGVTIPGMGLFLLAVAPFVDKNPSHAPSDRKFAISIFTLFLMLWAVLVIIGSFFRGPGFNFVFPWNNGIFFDL